MAVPASTGATEAASVAGRTADHHTRVVVSAGAVAITAVLEIWRSWAFASARTRPDPPAPLRSGSRAASRPPQAAGCRPSHRPVSYTHLRAHETRHDLVCRLL